MRSSPLSSLEEGGRVQVIGGRCVQVHEAADLADGGRYVVGHGEYLPGEDLAYRHPAPLRTRRYVLRPAGPGPLARALILLAMLAVAGGFVWAALAGAPLLFPLGYCGQPAWEGSQHIIWGCNYFTLPVSRCWLVWNKPERNFTLAECELAWTNFDAVARVYDCRRSDPDRVHPTQKPLALMRWCVGKTTGIVCDPFAGSGTTGHACILEDRPCVLIERDERWCAAIATRMEQAASHLFAQAVSP